MSEYIVLPGGVMATGAGAAAGFVGLQAEAPALKTNSFAFGFIFTVLRLKSN